MDFCIVPSINQAGAPASLNRPGLGNRLRPTVQKRTVLAGDAFYKRFFCGKSANKALEHARSRAGRGSTLDHQQRLRHRSADERHAGRVDGIGPKDELEGMMAAQLIAAHNAAMECYRRAMLSDQTFESRRENLTQANKLSRTWATLLEALNRHRGKGHQRVTVEHVHVHPGGQAVVGMVEPLGDKNQVRAEELHAKQIAPCT
jgi:hypothetical protein